jgi:hypothetical protein
MPKSLNAALCEVTSINPKAPVPALQQIDDYTAKVFLAGAVWGMQAAKLSQAEIAAIVAAVAAEKEKA